MLRRILILLMVVAVTIPALAQEDDDDPIKFEGFFGTETITFDGEVVISYPTDWHTEAVAGGVTVTNDVALIDRLDSPDLVEPATGEILLNINVLPQSLTAEQDVETARDLINLVISEASGYAFGELESYTLRGRDIIAVEATHNIVANRAYIVATVRNGGIALTIAYTAPDDTTFDARVRAIIASLDYVLPED